MGPSQLTYFKQKLLNWRSELLDEVDATLAELRHDSHHEVGDEADRATREAAQTLELRTRDRYRKLLGKIDAALDRIDDGTYGWCEDTGEPIGLARLEARPVTTLRVEAQERRELRERLTGVDLGRK
ncbi:MAG: RNA polymerase-binding protein DksA [Candidatus Thiodiazotropha lotti]|nr:RNA polymerase-binding protein DksA [Candidatus Thiodiazotropha lotti]